MARPRTFEPDVVLEHSMRLFWTHGYHGTSLDTVAETVGLKKQSLYGAFGDKHSLFLKVLERYTEISGQRIQEALHQSPSPRQDIEALFYSFIASCSEKCTPEGCLLVNTILEFGQTDPEVLAMIQRAHQGFEHHLEEAIYRAQQLKEITAEFNSALLAKSLINTLWGLRILEKRGGSLREMESILQVTLQCLSPPIKRSQ